MNRGLLRGFFAAGIAYVIPIFVVGAFENILQQFPPFYEVYLLDGLVVVFGLLAGRSILTRGSPNQPSNRWPRVLALLGILSVTLSMVQSGNVSLLLAREDKRALEHLVLVTPTVAMICISVGDSLRLDFSRS
jgi:hypothetical protein